jgi:ABC-type Fe3+ transport system permease subunit
VVVPLLMPTLVAVGILTFVAAVRDIGRIVFVVGGTNRPLALLQLDLMVSERFEAAAVVGLIVTLLSIGVATLARLSLRPSDEM